MHRDRSNTLSGWLRVEHLAALEHLDELGDSLGAMYHYRRLRDGKVEYSRGSEDTARTAQAFAA